jgi:hypothetical protein
VSRTNLLTIEAHAAFELALGAALIAIPLALGLSPAALIAGMAIGGLLAGVALAGFEPGGRGGLPLSAHAAYDWAFTAALACTALALGIADGARPLIVFLAAAAAELTLRTSTSYSARGA